MTATLPTRRATRIEASGAREAPLSPMQRSVWVANSMAGASDAYHTKLLFWLNGPLDADALQRALEAVSELHDVLRTRFLDSDPPRALVVAGLEVPLRRTEATRDEAIALAEREA